MPEEVFGKSLFEDFSEEEIKDLLSFSNAYKFEKDQIIFKLGDKDDSVYIIRDGEIELSAINSKNEEVAFSIVGNGTVLGEIAFFDGRERSTSAKALTALESIVITKEKFSELEKIKPELAIKTLKEFGRITAERLRLADEILVDVVQL